MIDRAALGQHVSRSSPARRSAKPASRPVGALRSGACGNVNAKWTICPRPVLPGMMCPSRATPPERTAAPI
eukprot:15473101-Alexandrium_andersonii.AAC.1